MRKKGSGEVLQDNWTRCYTGSWVGVICPEAFAHPAKFAPALCQRIFEHAREEHWLPPGCIVFDPFAGVALGALHALLHGCAWIGNELEPRFFALAEANIAKWMAEYRHLPSWGPWGMVTLGDSRHLQELLPVQAQMVCGSPPYAEGWHKAETTAVSESRMRKAGYSDDYIRRQFRASKASGGNMNAQDYGTSPGQLGAMLPGSVAAVLSSPPYAASTQVNNSPHDMTAGKAVWGNGTNSAARVKQDYHDPHTLGNLSSLVPGMVESVISSPPYAGSLHGQAEALPRHELEQRFPHWHTGGRSQIYVPRGYGETSGQLSIMPSGAIDQVVASPPFLGARAGTTASSATAGGGPCAERVHTIGSDGNRLGTTAGQLALEHPDTFWDASSAILEQTNALLRPGGHLIWVTKRYVREGAIVDFTADWIRLCESAGWRLLHHHRAMLVDEYGTQTHLFDAEDTQHQTIRASFFRRLHMQKRPDLAILWEDVTCWEKPA